MNKNKNEGVCVFFMCCLIGQMAKFPNLLLTKKALKNLLKTRFVSKLKIFIVITTQLWPKKVGLI